MGIACDEAQIRFSRIYWIQEPPQKRIFCSLPLKVKKINMNLINLCVCSLLKVFLFTNFSEAELNLHWNIPFEKLSQESGYTHLDRHSSIVRDLSLKQAKKENRILPIILIKGEPLNFEVQCVVDGYNKQLSKGIPTLRTTLNMKRGERVDFEDQENEQASWKAIFQNIRAQDKGKQIITCDYEQDNFSKTIELTLEIYAKVKKVETGNLTCVNDEMKCEGTLSITYEGGEERNKWIKDELKEQALKLFPSANFIDGKPENNFKVQVDFEKLDAADRKKYLGTKAENPQKLCGCIPKTKAIKPIHDEISNNYWIVQPTQPSPQKQFLDYFTSNKGPFFYFILLFYYL